MLFKKNAPMNGPSEVETAAHAAEVPAEGNPFADIAEALIALYDAGDLPEGFDLEAACSDPAFATLLQEFEPKAAVRIYAAEAKAESAYADAMEAMTEKLNARKALPKSTRTNRAVSPAPDYLSLSPEAFRALENQYKTAARSGKRIKL